MRRVFHALVRFGLVSARAKGLPRTGDCATVRAGPGPDRRSDTPTTTLRSTRHVACNNVAYRITAYVGGQLDRPTNHRANRQGQLSRLNRHIKESRVMTLSRPFNPRLVGALVLAASLAAAAFGLRAQESDPVVARANGVDSHESDIALAEDDIGAGMPQMGPDQKRDYIITYLTDIVILSQAADKQQLANRNDVKQRIEFERRKALMEAMLQNAGKAAMTDDALYKVYDRRRSQGH